MIQCCNLVKAGYGTLQDVQAMDTPDFLDALEYEEISVAIQNHIVEEARK